VLGLDSRPAGPLFHHHAFFVDKPAEIAAELGQQSYELGYALCWKAISRPLWSMRARDCGYFIELFTLSPQSLQIDDTVNDTSIGWDASDLIRTFAI